MQGVIRGLTPGLHGFHIHQFGDVREGCQSMGGHYNPDGHNHGAQMDLYRHVGDLGNIQANSNGEASFTINDSKISLTGDRSILGRGVVVCVLINFFSSLNFKCFSYIFFYKFILVNRFMPKKMIWVVAIMKIVEKRVMPEVELLAALWLIQNEQQKFSHLLFPLPSHLVSKYIPKMNVFPVRCFDFCFG